jgi:chemotaxis protein CheX
MHSVAQVRIKAEQINPFVDSVYDVFRNTLHAGVERGNVSLPQEDRQLHELLGIVGVCGEMRGTIAIGLTRDTAGEFVARMTQLGVNRHADTMADGIADLISRIARGAMARFNTGTAHVIDVSLPTVLSGADYKVEFPRDAQWIEIPFHSEFGEFELRISLQSRVERHT